MAIDIGDRRTGLALGDDETGLVSPLVVLDVPIARLAERLGPALHEHGPDALVIGLPLNMDGSEGPRAQKTRAVGEALAARFELPMHFQDERLTSFAAEGALTGTTRREKRRRRDALAAAEILRDFLATRTDRPS